MTGIGGCRSSGVLGASAVVSNENAKLISIHAAITIASNAAVTVKVFNGTDNTGTEVARIEDNGTFNVVTDKLAINGTAVTATAAEINLIDGGTARGTTALADVDGILINDAGTMRMTNVQTVSAYMSAESVGGSNIVTTGALNSGSIATGFGAIDNGASNITTGGLLKIDVDADANDVTGDSATGRFTLASNEDLKLYHGGTDS